MSLVILRPLGTSSKDNHLHKCGCVGDSSGTMKRSSSQDLLRKIGHFDLEYNNKYLMRSRGRIQKLGGDTE